MNERRWAPQIGDHVYHICEYNVMDIELKIKGLEGFRTYGIEVVESVVEKPYRWKSCGMGCTTVCEKREVGDNANNLFFWKPSDYGKRLFATREEAAALAEQRANDMDHGLGSRYDNKPMYKNWKKWGVKDLPELPKKEKKPKRKRAHAPLPEGFEDVYSRWRDGELTTVQAALEIEMPQSSFSVAAARELKKRGETHTYRARGRSRELPEDFNNVYEEWENGEIGITEAGRKLGMDYKSFKHHAEKMYKKRQEAGII